MAGSFPCARRSSATERTPSFEKVMSASPGFTSSKSISRRMHTSGVLRRWRISSHESPVLSMMRMRRSRASGAAQRCTSGARTPRIARVHAKPRSRSAIIWHSSITATSYRAERSSFSAVAATWVSPSRRSSSSPVVSEHATPRSSSRSCASSASRRSGARYTPVPALRSRSNPAYVLPVFVPPM